MVDGVAERYDAMYGGSSYDDAIWEWQRPLVRRMLSSVAERDGRLKYLDFACGTGRVISAVEDLTTDAIGVDISPLMLARAAERVRSRLICGDILADPKLVDRDYDVITAFRFFLNTEPEMRLAIMRDLAQRLRDASSLLIFNVHGSRQSVLTLTSGYRRLRGWPPLGLMAPAEVRALVAASGLEIRRLAGFGTLPRRLYRLPIARAIGEVDRRVSRLPLLARAGQDLVFVCTRPSA
ncbi:MAG TPA: methyltransferase domain-containing protein [Candidatus Limnocylindria bacterium]